MDFNIPSFNPVDLANNIIRKIKGGEIKRDDALL